MKEARPLMGLLRDQTAKEDRDVLHLLQNMGKSLFHNRLLRLWGERSALCNEPSMMHHLGGKRKHKQKHPETIIMKVMMFPGDLAEI